MLSTFLVEVIFDSKFSAKTLYILSLHNLNKTNMVYINFNSKVIQKCYRKHFIVTYLSTIK